MTRQQILQRAIQDMKESLMAWRNDNFKTALTWSKQYKKVVKKEIP